MVFILYKKGVLFTFACSDFSGTIYDKYKLEFFLSEDLLIMDIL
jgi:hypothetical protein